MRDKFSEDAVRELIDRATPLELYNLGMRHANGDGISKDEVVAARFFQRAADLGHADAQYALALMYMYGKGVRTDMPNALELLLRAAQQGHVAAQDFLELSSKGQTPLKWRAQPPGGCLSIVCWFVALPALVGSVYF